MIKHFPSQFVSFENDFCSRTPEYPHIGENVRVDCIIESNGSVPELEYWVYGGENVKVAGKGDGRRYSFELGAFNERCFVNYRITCGGERSRIFTFPVCEIKRCERFEALYFRGDSFCGVLGDGYCVNLDLGENLNVSCSGSIRRGAYTISADLPLCGTRLKVGGSGLWSFGKCKVTAITLELNADGAAVRSTVETEIERNHVFGTGERFDSVDQNGKSTSGQVEERCFYQEEITYIPVPFFFTDTGLGWYCRDTVPAAMDFGDKVTITRESAGSCIFEDTLFCGEPKQLLKTYFALSGQPELPPEWVYGVWLSANGWNRTKEVYEVLDEMRENSYPASVLVLEPWSDESTFHEWDRVRFAAHESMMRDVRAAGLHVVLWQISTIHAGSTDEKEALENGYCIKNEDGTPFYIPDGWCKGNLICDFSNPKACEWWFGHRKHLLEEGVEGFKTDGGEYVMDKTVRQFDGKRGLEARNLHPLQYQKAYHDFMRENGVNGVTFSRSGYGGCQTTPLHWAGDQSSEWRELRGQLAAGVSSALSGIMFWGFDIGSLGGPLPDKELYLRSTAFACFCPIMQWHSMVMPDQLAPRYDKKTYNDRSPWNLARQFGDKEILTIASRFARLRHSLIPYIASEAEYCAANGRPLMAQLCIDFPQDKNAWDSWDEYMFGRDLLVAPVYTEGATGRDVYFPEGVWEDIFTRSVYEGGATKYVECPLDRIPVFMRKKQ